MERDILKYLLNWRNRSDRKPLILKGARQVGKTYILREFGEQYFQQVHYLDFEKNPSIGTLFEKDISPKKILTELSLILDATVDTKNDLLVFDEVQQCPRALTALKYFHEEIPELALCAAGSLLGLELSDFSFPVGKVEFLSMFPLSFFEFLRAIGDNKLVEYATALSTKDSISEPVHSQFWERFRLYLVVGGLPDVVTTYLRHKDNLLEALREVRSKQSALILAYQADMAKHSGKANAMHIERLWRNVPAQLAKELDGSAPKYKFKGVIPGVKGYARLAATIDWLECAGLLIRVPIVNTARMPIAAFTKENTFKLYLFDVGLLGALGELPPQTILRYDYGTYKGYFAENFVAQEFHCTAESGLYSWKENESEIEFLREVDGDIIPIEVKSALSKKTRSLKIFVDKYQPQYRVILSGKRLTIDAATGVHNYPLYLASQFPLPRSEVDPKNWTTIMS